jgi:hypothetical protein
VQDVLDERQGFGAGVRYMIDTFEGLGQALGSQGCWDREQCRKAVLMLGVTFTPAATAQYADVYQLVLYNFLCMPEPPRARVDEMLEPANRPASLRETPREELDAPADECRAALGQWVDQNLEDLRAIEEQVVDEVDMPALARRTGNLAAAIKDPEDSKKYFRLGSEYRSTIHRNLNLLEKLSSGHAARPSVRVRAGDRTGSSRQRPRASATADGKPATAPPPHASRPTRDIKEPVAAGDSAEGRDNPSSNETEVVGSQSSEWFIGRQHSGSRNEPSPGEAAAPDEPEAEPAAAPADDPPTAPQRPPGGATAARTRSNRDEATDGRLREPERPREPPGAGRTADAAGQAEPWWVTRHRSRDDPIAAGPSADAAAGAGRPPPAAA